MGIQNLLPFVKKATREGNVSELEGQSVGVDVSCWLHRGVFGCVDKLAQGQSSDLYIRYCMKYIRMLISHRIHVVLVFDGKSLPAKESVNKERRERRKDMKERGLRLAAEGRTREARQCFERATEVTFDIIRELILAVRGMEGVDVVVAPYEADAQLAFLCQEGLVAAAITEDSDLIAFGCKKAECLAKTKSIFQILFKMDQSGAGVFFERENLYKTLGLKSQDQFSFTNFRRICITAGCDYISEGLKGIGLGKAAKFFSKTTKRDIKILKRLPLYLNMPGLKVSDQFLKDFERAERTFLHQVVFNPVTGSLQPLTPYEDGDFLYSQPASQQAQSQENLPPKKWEAKDFPFAGKIESPRKAKEFCIGNSHPYTSARVDDFDTETLGKWSLWNPSFKPGQSTRVISSPRKPLQTAFQIEASPATPAPSSSKICRKANGADLNSSSSSSSGCLRSPLKIGTPETHGIPQEIADIYGIGGGRRNSVQDPKEAVMKSDERAKEAVPERTERMSRYFGSPSIPIPVSKKTRNPFKVPRRSVTPSKVEPEPADNPSPVAAGDLENEIAKSPGKKKSPSPKKRVISPVKRVSPRKKKRFSPPFFEMDPDCGETGRSTVFGETDFSEFTSLKDPSPEQIAGPSKPKASRIERGSSRSQDEKKLAAEGGDAKISPRPSPLKTPPRRPGPSPLKQLRSPPPKKTGGCRISGLSKANRSKTSTLEKFKFGKQKVSIF